MRRWLVVLVVAFVAVVGIAGQADAGGPVRDKVKKLLPTTTTRPPAKPKPAPTPPPPPPPRFPALPPDSGNGHRIVYSIQQQRVWIVEANNETVGSWLVSGRSNAPSPGTYSISSRSRHSRSENGSVTFEFMLRFTKASTGNAIGFHSIPVDKNGKPIQSEEELGQPRSRGCVRQKRSDAELLWNWAPDGTVVRVTP